jgi:hypothetical protein
MRTDFEKGAALCARELAGLFDRAYSLGHRVMAEIYGNEVVQFSPFGREWNLINNGLVRIAPMADKIGARKLVATDARFWTMATYQSCVPRMKMCVDLQLSAVKVAMSGFNKEQADFSLKVFEVVPDEFALLVGVCRDAPKLRLNLDPPPT